MWDKMLVTPEREKTKRERVGCAILHIYFLFLERFKHRQISLYCQWRKQKIETDDEYCQEVRKQSSR